MARIVGKRGLMDSNRVGVIPNSSKGTNAEDDNCFGSIETSERSAITTERYGLKPNDNSIEKPERYSENLLQTITLEATAKEYLWLWDLRHGLSAKAVASRSGVNVRHIHIAAARAARQEYRSRAARDLHPPRLIPLFPIGGYSPHSVCAHHRPIEIGSVLCCMVCHSSGMDGHPALCLDRTTLPAPEHKVAASARKGPSETRILRRRKLFGSQVDRRI